MLTVNASNNGGTWLYKILVSEVENGMAKACQLLYHREAADRLFVAEATTCLAQGLLIDFNALEMCRCL